MLPSHTFCVCYHFSWAKGVFWLFVASVEVRLMVWLTSPLTVCLSRLQNSSMLSLGFVLLNLGLLPSHSCQFPQDLLETEHFWTK